MYIYNITILHASVFDNNRISLRVSSLEFLDGLSFTNLPDTIEVQENTANPSTIFIVSYTGVDASATATLSTTYSSLFAINSSSKSFLQFLSFFLASNLLLLRFFPFV